MDQTKIDLFVIRNSQNFTNAQLDKIREAMLTMDDSKAQLLLNLDLWNTTTMLLLAIFVGSYGVDRFLLNDVGMGVLKLLTCGGCLIWWIVDIINIKERTMNYNFKKVRDVLMMEGISIY